MVLCVAYPMPAPHAQYRQYSGCFSGVTLVLGMSSTPEVNKGLELDAGVASKSPGSSGKTMPSLAAKRRSSSWF